MKRLKLIPIGIAAVALLGVAVLIFLSCRGCGDRPRSSESTATATGAPPGWDGVKTEETSSTVEKLNPFHRPTKTDELLKDWPAGTKIFEVGPSDETTYVALTPNGNVHAKQKKSGKPPAVTVHENPPANIALELRPFLGGGAGLGGLTAGAGVDALRLWRVHLGAGVTYDQSENVAGVLTTSYNVWRNIDIRVASGYGTGGATAAALLTLAIE